MDAIKEGMLASAKAAEAAARLGESLFGGKQKFNSQVATNRSQSERLLALGLKKETADCYWFYCDIAKEWKCTILSSTQVFKDYPTTVIPAWSLHRLIKLAYGNWKEDIVPIYLGDSYDMLIGRIEFQVKQGKFNKEYLV